MHFTLVAVIMLEQNWWMRNVVVFKNMKINLDFLVQRLFQRIEEFTKLLKDKNRAKVAIEEIEEITYIPSTWQPSPPASIKLNFDATWTQRIASLGFIGKAMHCWTHFTNTSSVEEA